MLLSHKPDDGVGSVGKPCEFWGKLGFSGILRVQTLGLLRVGGLYVKILTVSHVFKVYFVSDHVSPLLCGGMWDLVFCPQAQRLRQRRELV